MTRRRKIILSIVAVLVVAGVIAGTFLYGSLNIQAGSGPAGPAVPREPFASAWTDRPVLLLGVGDSITGGYGVPAGKGYFERLHKNAPGDDSALDGANLPAVLPNLKIRNVAVHGSNSLDHLGKQVAALDVQPADVIGIVVLTTGGNDLIHDYGRNPPREGAMFGATFEQARPWIANFRQRLDDMITQVQGRFPGGCHIFLANIYDPSDGLGRPWFLGLVQQQWPDWPDGLAILNEYNAIIGEAAARHVNVHLVDIHAAFMGHGAACGQFWRDGYRGDDPTFWYLPNIEDPSDRGQDALRRVFLNEMAKVLPKVVSH